MEGISVEQYDFVLHMLVFLLAVKKKSVMSIVRQIIQIKGVWSNKMGCIVMSHLTQCEHRYYKNMIRRPHLVLCLSLVMQWLKVASHLLLLARCQMMLVETCSTSLALLE